MQPTWKELYDAWRHQAFSLPDTLSAPMTATPVAVEYKRQGYIYGYDWLSVENARQVKTLAASDPIEFMLAPVQTTKGTIHTAQMLLEAKDAEERAAIWIAATAKDILEASFGDAKQAYSIWVAACDFLRTRFDLWHYAMRRLVPEIMIPNSVLKSVSDEVAPFIGLIQMNTLQIQSHYEMLLYTSLPECEKPEHRSLRI